MIHNLTALVSLASLLVLLYGVLQLVTWPTVQECRMTYMFQYPQFTRIAVAQDPDHPAYKLFAYSEGGSADSAPPPATPPPRRYTGSPVLFVHGNAGSHKQMRSLASVALRKSLDLARSRQPRHLDYFAVDYNEELSAAFGGYLQPQADYLAHCVHAISRLYNGKEASANGLIIVAHSMGGKVAQAAMQHANVSALVHTLLMIATPVDRPVVDVDFYTSAFYRRVDTYWQQHRSTQQVATNLTATCGTGYECTTAVAATETGSGAPNALLDHVLLVTIGGGERDQLVHAGLTQSRFGDLHAMSSAVPLVWLSTDHLCSVWCLQQVLVINRFLFDIVAGQRAEPHTKQSRLLAARQHLAPHLLANRQTAVQLVADAEVAEFNDEWQEDSRRQFVEQFPKGFGLMRTQMIRLHADAQYRYLDLQLVNARLDEREGAGWLFGCAALETSRASRFCSRAERLDGYGRRVPAVAGERMVVQLDLHEIRREHPQWTHLLVRTAPTAESFHLSVDIHGDRRELHVQMPKWYSFSWSPALIETDVRATSLRLHVSGLGESYQSLEVEVSPRADCERAVRQVTSKICVPWTEGFERYQHFNTKTARNLFVDVPTDKPHGYNTTQHPVTIDFYLQSTCPLTIRVRNSFPRTAANIAHQFGHWLPAHLVAALFLGLKHQLTVTPKAEPFKCAQPAHSLRKSASFFIITASRVFVKMIQWTGVMPPLDGYEHSMVVCVLVHGAAVALVVLLIGAVGGVVGCGGSLLHRVCRRFGRCSLLRSGWSEGVVALAMKMPATVGIVLLGIVMSTCGGLALVLACVFYLLILMDLYKNYLVEVEATDQPTDVAAPGTAEEPANPTEDETEVLTNTPENTAESPTKSTPVVANHTDVANNGEDDDDNAANNDDDLAAPSTAALDAALHATDEEMLNDAELNRMIRETMEQRKKEGPLAQAPTDEAQRRAEYEAMDVRQNAVHFHSALFVALMVLTLLNAPSVLAWWRQLPFSYSLNADPSFIPAVVAILSLVVMCQVNAPRQINGYSTLGSLLYMMAALSILYGQDSIYRLNAFVAATFVCLAAHQWLTPTVVPIVESADIDADGQPRQKKKPLTPAEIDDMLEKLMAAERLDREQRVANGEVLDDEDEVDEVDEDEASEGAVEQEEAAKADAESLTDVHTDEEEPAKEKGI